MNYLPSRANSCQMMKQTMMNGKIEMKIGLWTSSIVQTKVVKGH